MNNSRLLVRVDALAGYASAEIGDGTVRDLQPLSHDVYRAATVRQSARGPAGRPVLGLLQILDIALHGFTPPSPGILVLKVGAKPRVVDLHDSDRRTVTDEFNALVHDLLQRARTEATELVDHLERDKPDDEAFAFDIFQLRRELVRRRRTGTLRPMCTPKDLRGTAVQVLAAGDENPFPVAYVGPLSSQPLTTRVAEMFDLDVAELGPPRLLDHGSLQQSG